MIQTVCSQNDMISLWSSLLSFGHWLGQQIETQMIGRRLASRIMIHKDEGQISLMMHEARVMTISLMFRELQCLSEDEQVDQLEQIIAVYASFYPALDDNSTPLYFSLLAKHSAINRPRTGRRLHVSSIQIHICLKLCAYAESGI